MKPVLFKICFILAVFSRMGGLAAEPVNLLNPGDSLPVPIVTVASYPVELTFESNPLEVELHGGEITSAPEEVISGDRALLGDTRTDDRKYFEFAQTVPGYFQPGYTYTMTFRYRVLRAREEAKLYTLLRSKRQGWGRWDRGWTNFQPLTAGSGVQTGEISIGLDTMEDYQLMFGIQGDARVVIDDIRIAQGAPYAEPDPEQEQIDAIPAEAETVHTWDFESDPEHANLGSKGEIVEGAEALNGARSFQIDSMELPGQWNGAFYVSGDFLPGGYTYYVQLIAKPLEWGPLAGKGRDPHAYIAVKRADGSDKTLGWKRWTGTMGKTRPVYLEFEAPEGVPAKLELAIFTKGKMVFDDIVIRRVPLEEKAITSYIPIDPAASEPVWREEFEGGTLDESKWNVKHEPRTGGWWSPENVTVEDGSLVLSCTDEETHFAVGAVTTEGKFEFTYGYVEARMKLPAQEGHWPGIWLFTGSVTNIGNGGMDGTEIDIVEVPKHNEDKAHQTLHWDGYSLDHKSKGHTTEVPGLREGWHTYAVDWSPDGYVFFIDGKETWRTDAGGGCKVPLYIILSDELGGWSGNPKNATLPDRTHIDYIRVWQR